MTTLIIYDSFFGNTEKIARAIGKGLGSPSDCSIIHVNDFKKEQLTGLELLVVGSPTRKFTMTPAIKKLLNNLPARSLKGVKIAAFDTCISVQDIDSRFLTTMINIFGYAAESIANKLLKKGGEQIIPPEGFIVEDSEGPLRNGELKRAEEWGKNLISK